MCSDSGINDSARKFVVYAVDSPKKGTDLFSPPAVAVARGQYA